MAPALPFKAVIDAGDLFAANGVALPNTLTGMVLSGYAVGSGTLHCIRAYVTQILFTFQSGHFTVYPEQTTPATEVYPHNALGYFSDEYGNTCLSGKLLSNVPATLTHLASLESLSSGLHQLTAPKKITLLGGLEKTIEHSTQSHHHPCTRLVPASCR